MTIRPILLGAVLAAAPSPVVMAQSVEPQTLQAPAGSAEVAQCVQAQTMVTQTLDAAAARLEAARQTNSPATMRAAVDAFDAVLRDVRAQLAPCGQMAAFAVGPMAGRVMPSSSPDPAAAPSGQNMANMPGHNMATMPALAAQKPAVAPPRAAAPAAPKQGAAPAGQSMANTPGHNMGTMPASASADPQPGHAMTTATNPAARLADLMCQPAVDPKTAPRATYMGKAYYFCSVADRDLFLKAPAKYLER